MWLVREDCVVGILSQKNKQPAIVGCFPPQDDKKSFEEYFGVHFGMLVVEEDEKRDGGEEPIWGIKIV